MSFTASSFEDPLSSSTSTKDRFKMDHEQVDHTNRDCFMAVFLSHGSANDKNEEYMCSIDKCKCSDQCVCEAPRNCECSEGCICARVLLADLTESFITCRTLDEQTKRNSKTKESLYLFVCVPDLEKYQSEYSFEPYLIVCMHRHMFEGHFFV
jgi:hypothetical protein